jgi:hypothetical protein
VVRLRQMELEVFGTGTAPVEWFDKDDFRGTEATQSLRATLVRPHATTTLRSPLARCYISFDVDVRLHVHIEMQDRRLLHRVDPQLSTNTFVVPAIT